MRKMSDEIYFVHDELLYDLYNLNTDGIQYQLINGEPYLVNISKKRKYEIGFRIKLYKPLNSRIKSGSYMYQSSYLFADTIEESNLLYKEFLEEYGKFLVLSNFEKYMLNVLIDKYLCNHDYATITLKEIETKYRHKCMDKRYICLNDDTFNKYVRTLDLLANKELYLKTGSTFRKSCYGSNNILTTQDLLCINNHLYENKNKLEITYSLGLFGKVIKNSKRYSTLVPPDYYKVNINQVKQNLVAMYIARLLYIEQGIKRASIEYHYKFKVDFYDLVDYVEDRIIPITSNYVRYKCSIIRILKKLLLDLKKTGKIFDYEIKEVRSNKTKTLTKEEREREEWFKESAAYWGEREIPIKVEKMIDVTVYISEPIFECLDKDMY